MISRIMLSLKKAADPLRGDWSLWDSSIGAHFRGVEFASPEGCVYGREDDIPFDVICSESQVAT